MQDKLLHDNLLLIGLSHDGQIFDGHGHVHGNRSQSWVVGFTRKRLPIVLVGWLA